MSELFNFFIEPFQLELMRRALYAAIIIAIVCALFSCFLVLKGWSLIGDAISHAVLPGIAVAYLIGIPFIVGAFISGIFCSFATGFIKNNSRIKEDTVMGILFSGMFAIGIIMVTKIHTNIHLSHILFGNILGITQNEFIFTVVISIIISAVILLKLKDFILFCFDATQAKVVGLPVTFLHYLLLSMLSLTIVTTLQAAGIVLVIAMLISPGITAFLLTKRFELMLIIAVLVSVTASVIGTIISYHLDADTGPSIVIVQAIIFVLAYILSLILRAKKPQHA
ncbi:metal ABC transporter permease [Wohlfahrtiimonas larvae]|uniref:Iron/manganese ABC transporter permease subunit YfeD n=1 Tax=Wohlfahrtiimonas larvae TaxID=1157986 RepID=A0ABP9MNZ8_9GAMM|nr:metal ABC transporter permease [Wohlfahrtiimonas larvae]